MAYVLWVSLATAGRVGADGWGDSGGRPAGWSHAGAKEEICFSAHRMESLVLEGSMCRVLRGGCCPSLVLLDGL